MKVGIGLPTTVAGATGALLLDWATRADKGPFSSLGTIDRLAYDNYDSLVALAAAAGACPRIGLMTTVLLAPLHNAGVLAKQLATLDAISAGRLTVGLGIGARPEDYRAAPASFADRGKRFETLLDTLKKAWSGHAGIGPSPVQRGGPPLLIGGHSKIAFRRVARWGDGYIDSSGNPDQAHQSYQQAVAEWQTAGRPGRPRFVAGFYWCLGPEEESRAVHHIRRYYAFMGDGVEKIVAALVSSPTAITERLEGLASSGVDEAIAWPCIAHAEQVDRLAELVQ